MLVFVSAYRSLPTYSGVYQFLDKKGQVIYVGKAKNLRSRVSSYFSSSDLGEKTSQLVELIYKIRFTSVASEIEAFLLEERFIKKFKPKYNIRLNDGKSYIKLKITVKDTFPKVLLTRKEISDKALYFGPYTSTSSLKVVLKLIRKIFPYQSVENHGNKLCLYFHLGLCPCPFVTKDVGYKKTIKHIINFLNGNTKKVIKDLETERNEFSRLEDFEEAGKIQKQIDSINLITENFNAPFEYELNPNLRSDIVTNQLNEFQMELLSNNISIKNLQRIECYDISNISGKFATASMIVFTNGEKDSKSYRRFKIKNDYNEKPNDFAMMQEVLTRRFRHSEWPEASLIVVDGGKGQVSSALKILNNLEIQIPLIGLAKREEIVITSNLKEIKLARDSKALLLLMKIRDEAHRFAIAYHKKLRSKFIEN